ncbi:MAG: hypothetical protein GEV03_18570 [Streptosporangiales bacterium]|nr:hypothetical protein [Streptosporangiales bacterium]
MVDSARVAILREVLATTGWVQRSRDFARSLRTSTSEPGGLLLVGTPHDEPWHLAAHLDDEARWNDLPVLSPTLVRWSPPENAPPHLCVGLERIEAVRRGETLFVVTPDTAPVPLLERVSDARRIGATVLALDAGDGDLEGLAHEAITVTPGDDVVSFDAVQHLISVAAGESSGPARRGLRDRLARLLDAVSGPQV